MRAFVTGGAGFIGSNLVDALIEKGYQVTVYDNLSSGKKEFISQHSGKREFEFIQGGLSDIEKLKNVMRGCECIFHFASNPDIVRSMVETDLDLREGTILTYNVLETMRVNNLRKILYSSGSGVYGDVGAIATPEDYGPLLPISMYGASKLAQLPHSRVKIGTFLNSGLAETLYLSDFLSSFLEKRQNSDDVK